LSGGILRIAPLRALFHERSRVSVTDRCDLRCVYCMTEHQKFLPRPELLAIEELDRLCTLFIGLGTRKLRLTGGEPLVRRGFMLLVERLSRHLRSGALEELTLTTNGTRLAEYAYDLARRGVRRINVSLDTRDPDAFSRITRGGKLTRVLAGIAAAQAAGIAVKINVVALKGVNDHEIADHMRALWHGPEPQQLGCQISRVNGGAGPILERKGHGDDARDQAGAARRTAIGAIEACWAMEAIPELKKALMERALGGELTHHLGYGQKHGRRLPNERHLGRSMRGSPPGLLWASATIVTIGRLNLLE